MLRSNNDKKKGQTTPLMRTKPRWRKKKKHLVRIIQSAPTHCPNYYNLSYLYHCHSILTGCIGKGSISLENKTTQHHLHYRPPPPISVQNLNFPFCRNMSHMYFPLLNLQWNCQRWKFMAFMKIYPGPATASPIHEYMHICKCLIDTQTKTIFLKVFVYIL